MTNKYLNETYKLKNIIRYNSRTTFTKESVAEHSYYVTLFALKIMDDYNFQNSEFREKVLIKALLHDLPEIELNDITHDVKVKLGLYDYFKTYEEEYFKKNYNKYSTLMNKCDDKKIDLIVHLADIYSVIQFCNRELQLCNSTDELRIIYEDAINRSKNTINELEKLIGGK